MIDAHVTQKRVEVEYENTERSEMKKKNIWFSISVLLILGLLVGIFGCKAPATTTAPSPKPTASPTSAPTTAPTPAQPTVIKWKGQMVYPLANDDPKRFPGWFAGDTGSERWFVDWVKRRTGGRLIIDLAPAGSIVPAAESLSSIEDGVLDFIGHSYGGYYTGVIPEANVELGLPFAWETINESWDCLHRWGLYNELKKIYAEHNVFPIIYPEGERYSFYATFDITTSDNIKGRKIRALGIYGDLVQGLGGSPAVIPGTELYQALKLGTVDGAIYGVNAIDSLKLAEVVKYWVGSPNLNVIGLPFLINLKKFNALPQDIKAMIEEDAPYIMAGWALDYTVYTSRIDIMAEREGRIKIARWSNEDIAKVRKVGIGLWDKVAAASPRTARLVDIVKAQAKDLGKI